MVTSTLELAEGDGEVEKFTARLATLLVTALVELLTVTSNFAPLSETVVAGVV